MIDDGGFDDTDAASLTCVICLESFTWDRVEVHRPAGRNGPWNRAELPGPADPRRGARAQGAFIRCPNAEDGDPHYFPVEFAFCGDPVVIGFVGDSSAGKTCLLAAMTGQIDRDKLRPYGLLAEPINMAEHAAYVEELVDPFFRDGEPPPHTDFVTTPVRYRDAMLLRTDAGRMFSLVFFDASGENLKGLQNSHDAVRFLHRVNGLIFVADPQLITEGRRQDPTYQATMAALRWAQRDSQGRFAVPAAIAVTKSDLHRFDPPVDRWLNRPPRPDGLDLDLVAQESRDAFAFLHSRKAVSWLAPLGRFEQCTLHFVSASGAAFDAESGRFVRPARPRRVLEPLAAVLASLGLLDRPFVRGSSRF